MFFLRQAVDVTTNPTVWLYSPSGERQHQLAPEAVAGSDVFAFGIFALLDRQVVICGTTIEILVL